MHKNNMGNKKVQSANFSQQNTDSEITFAAFTASVEPEKAGYINFIIDCGCTSHLVSSVLEKNLTNIKSISPIKIRVANGEIMTAEKSAILKIYTNKSSERMMNISVLINYR